MKKARVRLAARAAALAVVVFASGCASGRMPKPAPHELDSRKVFGVTLQWGADRDSTRDWLTSQVLALEKKHGFAMDPDCRWRPFEHGSCSNPFAEVTRHLDAAAEKYRLETLGYFDIHTVKKGRAVRDFAGLSQGYFIDEIKARSPGPFVMDFSGDIFISSRYEGAPELKVAEPVIEESIFSPVDMLEGWMLASTSRDLGATMRNPLHKAETPWKEEFLRVVLFAEPGFEGARLDAWATAIVVGGEKLLKTLWKREPERGRWAYLVFDRELTPRCSENIDCELTGAHKNIRIRWAKR